MQEGKTDNYSVFSLTLSSCTIWKLLKSYELHATFVGYNLLVGVRSRKLNNACRINRCTHVFIYLFISSPLLFLSFQSIPGDDN